MVVDVDRAATDEVAATDEDATAVLVLVLVATTVAVEVEEASTEVEVARTEVEVARTEVAEARAVWGTVAQMAEPTTDAAVLSREISFCYSINGRSTTVKQGAS